STEQEQGDERSWNGGEEGNENIRLTCGDLMRKHMEGFEEVLHAMVFNNVLLFKALIVYSDTVEKFTVRLLKIQAVRVCKPEVSLSHSIYHTHDHTHTHTHTHTYVAVSQYTH